MDKEYDMYENTAFNVELFNRLIKNEYLIDD